MGNFFVKIEKSKEVLKRDGFLAGTKKIVSKVARVTKMTLSQPKGDVIFISGMTGAPAMYRTDYVAEELNEYGFRTGVLYEDDPFLLSKLTKARVIILNRVTWNDNIKKLLNQSEILKQHIIYDTDDLTFDENLFKKSNAYSNFTNVEKKHYKKTTGLEILKNKQLKAITTTTTFLAKKLNRFNKPVFVVKNKLSKQELKWTREARKIYMHRTNKMDDVRIGYFSGSVSHNLDFATILPVLEVILNRYKNVKLYLVGYLESENIFYKKFKKQIVELPFVPRDEYYKNIAQVDINLVPLEMNDFCQSKSEIKFLEAGIIGIPTVAVNNQTFSEVIAHGKNGLLAKNTDEWVNNLERLIDDRDLRITLGEKARQTVLRKYLTNSGDNGDYYKFLKQAIDN